MRTYCGVHHRGRQLGDWVSFPANTPTQVTTSADGELSYMVMKVNAMLYPWELIR